MYTRLLPSDDIPPAGGIWFRAKRPCIRRRLQVFTLFLFHVKNRIVGEQTNRSEWLPGGEAEKRDEGKNKIRLRYQNSLLDRRAF